MANTRKNRTQRKNRKNGENVSMVGGKIPAVGSKVQVYHGTARHTSGGLTKKHLMKTKAGRIVSRKKHAAGLKAVKKLRKLGYVAKKGTFKLFSKKRGGSESGFMGGLKGMMGGSDSGLKGESAGL